MYCINVFLATRGENHFLAALEEFPCLLVILLSGLYFCVLFLDLLRYQQKPWAVAKAEDLHARDLHISLQIH